jgi:protein-disulfide isomerase
MTRRAIVLLTGLVAVIVFATGAFLYSSSTNDSAPSLTSAEESNLIRSHSPILGASSARVTITEFFDPSCEACRAIYPVVKEIIADFPGDVRVVLRYTLFHPASEEAVRILEAARRQDKFETILAILLEKQEEWGADGAPNPARAWEIAGEAGLDLTKGKQDAFSLEVDRIIQQDMADVKAVNVTGTPTFFVNAKPLSSFGAQQLYDLVKDEVEQARQRS